MPLPHLVENETTDNNERGLLSQYYSGKPRELTTAFPKENCFRYATVKISFYTTKPSVLIIKFFPKHLYRALTFDNTHIGVETGNVFANSLISCPTHTISVNGNTYQLHTFPIQGEFFQITTYTASDEPHLYVNVGLSNYNHNTHLE
jgi:hypothetical protein|tara:strand:- start:6 stop:446 length:441 start_codon:yes stop_codon:yes gene_type:complete